MVSLDLRSTCFSCGNVGRVGRVRMESNGRGIMWGLHLHEDVVCHVVWFCGGQTQFAYVVDHMRKCFVGGDVAYAFVD